MNKIFTLIISFLLSSLVASAAEIKTEFISKFRCSPSNKVVTDLSISYILSNPIIPQLPSTDQVKIHMYYKVIDGPAKGKSGTIDELAKMPGVDSNTKVERVARFGQFNSPLIENTLRVFRSFYDPSICKPSDQEICSWDDILNVYQDATISTDGSLAAIMSNADDYTPDIVILDLVSNQKKILFTSGYHRPYEANGNPVGQVNFINGSNGAPRYLAFRDGGYRYSKVSVTFFDLETKEQLTVPREKIENLIGVTPNPTYPSYLDKKTYHSLDVEKIFSDVKRGVLPSQDVSIPFGTEEKVYPSCPPFQTIN